MSQSPWDDLVAQLKSEDVKVRRKAAKKLGDTGDPRVIPVLKNVYLHDKDERTRDIAHDALAAFKATYEGTASEGSRVLKIVVGVLSLLFVVSLVLNGLSMASDSDKESTDETPEAVAQLEPTPRDVLVARIEDRLGEVKTFTAMLRSEIETYQTTSTVECNLDLPVPAPVMLTELDRITYRDLSLVGDKLDSTLPTLNIAQLRWRHSCQLPEPDVEDVLEASRQLDQADLLIEEIAGLLKEAIDNPAPTVGPTVTPVPTATDTPEPATPTEPPPAATEVIETEPPADVPTTTTEPPDATATAIPTATPDPASQLPYPDLDYAAITRALNSQLIVRGDLENQYETGMLDRWKQAQANPESTQGIICALETWPDPFTLTPEQEAELARTDAADVELERAIQLVQTGVSVALQARAMYERDCQAETLATSAEEAIPLAEEALSKLNEAETIIDAINQRPAP